jgi:hypothetical protein
MATGICVPPPTGDVSALPKRRLEERVLAIRGETVEARVLLDELLLGGEAVGEPLKAILGVGGRLVDPEVEVDEEEGAVARPDEQHLLLAHPRSSVLHSLQSEENRVNI